ncbi:hypothetical protein AK812_SmicGene3098 [Symbiodinium microadriaticum]|uniref:Uncharacterized protein n=1 Tax=Symbiodinium microadriaticum TaxID=2951 RepID=A0A1Q9EZN7_SYMMI|nr:hypothetical protein AK812_SmicGene3098 [Symbiodinium microadriaticum]
MLPLMRDLRPIDSALADHVRHGLNWEVLSKTFQLIVSQQKPGIPLDFISITCGSCFAHFYQFSPKLLFLSIYLSYGGGVDGMFLSETEKYVRATGSTTALGDKVWEAICHEIKGSKNQLPFFRHGLLKLALAGVHLYATECKRDQNLVNVLAVVDSNLVAHVMNLQDKVDCEILAIVFTPKADVHEIEDLQPFGPQSVHPDFDVAHTVAMIHCEMHSLVQNHGMPDTMAKLRLCIRPTKLAAKTAVPHTVPKGKLILAPFSTKVVARTSTETMQGAVEVRLRKASAIAASSLLPPKTTEEAPGELAGFLSPFFLVQSVEDQSKGNMTVVVSGNKQAEIRIPLLKNSVASSAGQELPVYKEMAPKQGKPLKAASPERRVNGFVFFALTRWHRFVINPVSPDMDLMLRRWNRQCILALTDRALDLRANIDGGSLNSEVWAELLQARQDVDNKAIEEAFKAEDQHEPGNKKHWAVSAFSKHDFMAPPVLTAQYKGHSFRAKAKKAPKKRRHLPRADSK